MLVDAVAGLQRGDNEPAFSYLRFVDTHRGRSVAMETKKTLSQYRDSVAFKNCHTWAASGYRPPARRK